MRYNLADDHEILNIKHKLAQYIAAGYMVEFKKVNESRSLNQNSYLHLILSAFGMHFGYTLEEAKYLYKQVNSATYRYEKKGRTFWRSSADLNKDEMSTTIEKFKQLSAEQGCPLPDAEDAAALRQISNEMEGNRYL